MLTSPLHHADAIMGMPTVHDDVTITSCWCHPYPGQPHGSGRLVFGSGQPIRAKKTHVTRGTRLGAWLATSSARDGDFDNFHFWAKIKHYFKPCTLIPIVGEFRLPHAQTGGVLIFAQRRRSTLTQYLTWFGKTANIHGRESILLEIEKGNNTNTWYMEEEDHFTQTQLPALFAALATAAIAALHFLSWSLLICSQPSHFALFLGAYL